MSTRQTFHVLGSLFCLFGFVSGSWFLWLFGGFFFFMTEFHRWWLRRLPHFIHVEWEAEQSRVMPGTPVTITVRMTNRSWLPLPYSRIRFALPEHVTVEGADEAKPSNKQTVVQLWLSLPRRRQIERSFTLTPHRRGVVWLTEVHAELIDLFADEDCSVHLPIAFSLLVYPLPLPIPPLSLGETEPFGRRLSRQRRQEDPTFLRGIRPYMPGDRLKNVDWKASAKTGGLQTRQFEFTAHPRWQVVGHILPSFEPLQQRYNDETNERTISYLAAVAVHCRRQSLPYELLLNVKQRGKEFFQLTKSSGKAHHVHVMTQLARLHQYMPTQLFGVLRRLEQTQQRETVLVVSPRIDEASAEAMRRLVRRGHTVVLLDLSGDQAMYRRIEPTPAGTGGISREG
jgi:uncharacterized protein (DUF58 family)